MTDGSRECDPARQQGAGVFSISYRQEHETGGEEGSRPRRRSALAAPAPTSRIAGEISGWRAIAPPSFSHRLMFWIFLC